jgi:YD repeat-containing protein
LVAIIDFRAALTTRELSESTTPVGGTASTQSFTYDLDGKVETQSLGDKEIADPTYSTTTGLLSSVAYSTGTGKMGNGTSLSGLTRNAAGASTGMTWSFPNGSSVTDVVDRSQSGRVLRDVLTDDTSSSHTTESSLYSYDAAGRMVHASIPGHELAYGFAGSGGCGANTAAGMDGNRTSFSDTHNGGTPTTVAYCYDTLGDHTSTTLTDGTVVTYLRDATGRVVERDSTPPGGSTTVLRYTFSASGQFGVLNGSGTLLEQDVSLPGHRLR